MVMMMIIMMKQKETPENSEDDGDFEAGIWADEEDDN